MKTSKWKRFFLTVFLLFLLWSFLIGTAYAKERTEFARTGKAEVRYTKESFARICQELWP